MSASIRDVAKLAKVSPSTVSRVLNHSAQISAETIKAVEAAVIKLNYVPNEFARTFATGKGKIIALAIDSTKLESYANNFFNATIFGIERTAHAKQHNLLIINCTDSSEDMENLERLILGKKIAGLILPEALISRNLANKLAQYAFPYVVLGSNDTEYTKQINWVDINNVQAGAYAVRHLYQQGYTRLAFISNCDKEFFNQARLKGFSEECIRHGIRAERNYIKQSVNTLRDARQVLSAWLGSSTRPDAIICSSDKLAITTLRMAKSLGLLVPRDLGVFCYDNTELTQFYEPAVSCLEIDTYDLGVKAAELLFKQLAKAKSKAKGESKIEHILLDSAVCPRLSTQKIK